MKHPPEHLYLLFLVPCCWKQGNCGRHKHSFGTGEQSKHYMSSFFGVLFRVFYFRGLFIGVFKFISGMFEIVLFRINGNSSYLYTKKKTLDSGEKRVYSFSFHSWCLKNLENMYPLRLHHIFCPTWDSFGCT